MAHPTWTWPVPLGLDHPENMGLALDHPDMNDTIYPCARRLLNSNELACLRPELLRDLRALNSLYGHQLLICCWSHQPTRVSIF